MGEIRKLQQFGGSKALTVPASWLAMLEESYHHPISEVEVETNDATLIVRPLFNFGWDSLTWRTDEDPQHGPHQVAGARANGRDPKWTMLLDKLQRSGGQFIEDSWEYWRITSFADLHDGKLVEIFCGVGRKRVRVGR